MAEFSQLPAAALPVLAAGLAGTLGADLPRGKKHDISEAMSGHGHDDSASAYEAHDDHHETSSDDFPEDEPRSPGWLPLLGGALFLAGILAFIVFGGDDAAAAGSAVVADAASAPLPAAAAAPPPAAQRPAMRLPPGLQMPARHAAVPQPQ
ncbi:MAG: hypothetical protein ABI548_08090 [Polyangiaceae bacterium]